MGLSDEATPAEREMAEKILAALRDPEGRDDLRRVHALGVGAAGWFEASPVASDYCAARHFVLYDPPAGDPPHDMGRDPAAAPRPKPKRTPVTVRFSNGSGGATRHDGWSDVRGMATRFHLDDGSETDLIAMTLRSLFAPTAETFLDFSRAAVAAPCAREPWWRKIFDLLRLTPPMPDPYVGQRIRGNEGAIAFARRRGNDYVRTPLFLATLIGAPTSYLRAAYHAVHTFVVTGADGTRRWVRFDWQPIDGVLNLKPSERHPDPLDPPHDYLGAALADRLEQGPARFSLMMTLGETGDAFDDCSRPWPPHRVRIEMGTLTLDRVLSPEEQVEKCELMRFNPWRLTAGIEPSDDPLLRVRRDAYDIGSAWRIEARAREGRPDAACPFSGGRAHGG
jgi:catalase